MKKIIASILAFFSLGSAAETTEPTATAAAAAAVSEYTVISGEVLEINDSSLTLLLDMGEAPNGEAPDGQPPEKPDSDTSNSQPPEKPDGDASNSQPPEMPDGQAPNGQMPGGRTVTVDTSNAIITRGGTEVTVKDISVGDKVSVSAKDGELSYTESDAAPGSAPGGAPGGSSEVTQGSSANTISTGGEYSGESYSSTGDDENALRIDGAAVTLSDVTVSKSAGSSSNPENGDFYGVNAAILATNGATVDIKDADISSSAQNGNGVVSYGSGTTVNISDSTINTTADNSGGIQTTGGGTTNASDLTVTTAGNSSAAIRSDRGGGTVNVDGGSYTSNGYNSPAVYSTADITVKNAELTANSSEALVIEGKNSITLENCTVSGNMSDTEGASSDENVHSVMIYQSMSGDADVGTSEFSMTGGSLTSNNGDVIYVTNTHSIIKLSGVEITDADGEGCFMRVCGNSGSRGWGQAGSNGALVEFTADGQDINGDIIVDSISTLDMTLTNGSCFTGRISIAANLTGSAPVENNAVITIGEGCTWKLTGDCTITSLTNNGTIDFNGYTITLADGSVLK
uniref:hypothetical protein n=1 Tax=Candidatus Limivicinus sp. TaxID=3030905 RepID=UPI003FF03456